MQWALVEFQIRMCASHMVKWRSSLRLISQHCMYFNALQLLAHMHTLEAREWATFHALEHQIAYLPMLAF